MRHIKLNYTKVHNGCYSVYLERGNTYFFTSKKDTIEFLSSYKKLYTLNSHSLNSLSCRLYSLYRNNYFFLDYKTQRTISYEFSAYELSFERIFNDFSSTDQNSFSLKGFKAALWSLLDISNYLVTFAKTGKYSALSVESRTLYHELDRLLTDFELKRKTLNIPSELTKIKPLNPLQNVNNKNVI